MDRKEVLRKKMKTKLSRQKQSERRKKSRLIQKKIFRENDFLSSNCVMLYVSKGTGEVETGPVIRKALSMGKDVVLPVTLAREKRIKPVVLEDVKTGLGKGPYGIYEPVESKSNRSFKPKYIDLVVVPGLAFDRHNNRLGRGKGYYDRFLKQLPKKTKKIGLGFRFQLVDKLLTTKNDVSLTKVITD